MEPSGENTRHHWRQTLQPDPQDAREKALRHHRFDLWYGSHYLRFTKTRRTDGTILLSLQEKARLLDTRSAEPELRTADQLPSVLVYEEAVPTLGPTRGSTDDPNATEQDVIERGRLFFDHAARLLDAGEGEQRAAGATS